MGNEMGQAYKHKYLFTDYTENWIQAATLTDGLQNWFSDISEFASSNFGAGIVHMMQNPLDGYIYYCNIFNGTIYRIVNNNVLSVSRVSNNSVKMFPNPSNGELYFSGITGNYKITIYSITGKKILTTVASNNESIQLDVKAGFYLAKIENGEQQVTKKLIIK